MIRRQEAQGEFRNRPIHLACTANQVAIVHELLERDCSVTCRNEVRVQIALRFMR